MKQTRNIPAVNVSATELTQQVTRGVCRYLTDLGYSVLTEFSLRNGRRADVAALGPDGAIVIVEVKVTRADFLADAKWPDYRTGCDRFYFAVPKGFPHDLIPAECGLLVADGWGAAELRSAPEHKLHGTRRRALTLHFAREAAQRLHRITDPRYDLAQPRSGPLFRAGL